MYKGAFTRGCCCLSKLPALLPPLLLHEHGVTILTSLWLLRPLLTLLLLLFGGAVDDDEQEELKVVFGGCSESLWFIALAAEPAGAVQKESGNSTVQTIFNRSANIRRIETERTFITD